MRFIIDGKEPRVLRRCSVVRKKVAYCLTAREGGSCEPYEFNDLDELVDALAATLLSKDVDVHVAELLARGRIATRTERGLEYTLEES